MDLQNLKRWHWALIGLVVGLALSYMYSNWDPSAQSPSIGTGTLQADLLRVERRAEGDPPMIRNIRLYPPRVIEGQEVWLLKLDYLRLAEGGYVEHEVTATTPFRVERANGTELRRNDEVPNVRAYLDAVAAANEGLDYRYMWWHETPWVYTMWTGGSVLLIGGVWPTVLSLMVGAGLGRPPRQKEEEYDLSRFGKGKPEEAIEAAKPVVDEEELDAVTRAYEANLGSEGEAMPAETDAETAAAPPEVRKLAGTPIDAPPPPVKPVEDEDKEYVGEFYPVARPAHKKSDE